VPSWKSARIVLVLCAACRSAGGGPSPPPGAAVASIAVTSTAFRSGGAIPVDSTCDGANRSPQLTFSAPPEAARSLVVVADDPDAPGGTFTHWIAYDLRPDVVTLPEAADPAAFGGASGTNDFQRPGYAGPCPPKGELHHYDFRVFVLDARLGLAPGATRAEIDAAMSRHVLAQGVLSGTFSH